MVAVGVFLATIVLTWAVGLVFPALAYYGLMSRRKRLAPAAAKGLR